MAQELAKAQTWRQGVRLWAVAVRDVLWARRWKLLWLLLIVAAGQACEFLPPRAQPLCEALVKAFKRWP